MKLPRVLDPVELRVLGCLLEKEATTPEQYPLTLNALLAACNQRSNREPVMDLALSDVRAALDRLHAEVLVWPVSGARSERWRHSLDRRWELDDPEHALLTLLLLRGPQTPGELRGRAERLHPFRDPREVEAVLQQLAAGDEPLAAELPRQPGQKEARWTHLAGGAVEQTTRPSARAEALTPSLDHRVKQLEEQLERLAREVAELARRLS